MPKLWENVLLSQMQTHTHKNNCIRTLSLRLIPQVYLEISGKINMGWIGN